MRGFPLKSQLSTLEARCNCFSVAIEELRRLRGYDAYSEEILSYMNRKQLHAALKALENALQILLKKTHRHFSKQPSPANVKGKQLQNQKTEPRHKQVLSSVSLKNTKQTHRQSNVRLLRGSESNYGKNRERQSHRDVHGSLKTSSGKSNSLRSASTKDPFRKNAPSTRVDFSSDGGTDDGVENSDDSDDGLYDEFVSKGNSYKVSKGSGKTVLHWLSVAISRAADAFDESKDGISQALAVKVEVWSRASCMPSAQPFPEKVLTRFATLVSQYRGNIGNGIPSSSIAGVLRSLDVIAFVMRDWMFQCMPTQPNQRISVILTSGMKLDPVMEMRWLYWRNLQPSVVAVSGVHSTTEFVSCFDVFGPWVVYGSSSGNLSVQHMSSNGNVFAKAAKCNAHSDEVVSLCIISTATRHAVVVTGGSDQLVCVWYITLSYQTSVNNGNGSDSQPNDNFSFFVPKIAIDQLAQEHEHYGWVRSIAVRQRPMLGESYATWLLTGGGDGTVVLWTLNVPQALQRNASGEPRGDPFVSDQDVTSSATNISASSRLRSILEEGGEGVIPRVENQNASETTVALSVCGRCTPHTHWVVDISWISSDMAVSCSPDCGLALLGVEFNPTSLCDGRPGALFLLYRVERAHACWPKCLLPFGQFLLSGGSDGRVKVWQIRESGLVVNKSHKYDSDCYHHDSNHDSNSIEAFAALTAIDRQTQSRKSSIDFRQPTDNAGTSSRSMSRRTSSSAAGISSPHRRMSATRSFASGAKSELVLVSEARHVFGRTLALASAHSIVLAGAEEGVVIRISVDEQSGAISLKPTGDELAPLRFSDGAVSIGSLVYAEDLGLYFLHDHLSVYPAPCLAVNK